MKLCIPSMGNRGLDEQVGYHFGRVPYYTIVDTDTDEATVVPNTSSHMGGQGYPAEILASLDVHTMIVGGLGRRAIQVFEQNGVMVYVGASGTVREALAAFRNNMLEAATDENACRQHAFHEEEHGHHH